MTQVADYERKLWPFVFLYRHSGQSFLVNYEIGPNLNNINLNTFYIDVLLWFVHLIPVSGVGNSGSLFISIWPFVLF